MVAELKEISTEKIENARQRLSVLFDRFKRSLAEPDLLPESLEELSNALEELCAVTEELYEQYDQLTATRALLEEEQRHYQELFDSAPDGYLVTNMLGIIQEANNNAAKLFHTRRDFLIGKPIIVYVANREHVEFRRLLTRLHREESVSNWEATIAPLDGTPFAVECTVSRVHGCDQTLPTLRWILRDTTERKAIEERVKIQLRNNSFLCDINLAISSSLNLNTVLAVLLDRMAMLFPYPVASTVRLILPESNQIQHAISHGLDEADWERMAPVAAGLRTQEILRSKLPVAARNVQTDPQTHSRDFYLRNGLVSYLGAPLLFEDKIIGVLGLYTKTEHEFAKEEIDSLSALAVQAAIAIHNSQLYEQIQSQANALKKASEELEGRVHDRTSELAKANKVLKSEIAERKLVEDKLRQSEGQLISFTNQLEDHLIANDRLISVGELSASIAHEFNNPLQIILGFTQNLLQEESLAGARQQDLLIIEDEARRCAGIIRNLLDFARPTSNEPMAIVVNAIVQDSIKLVRGYLDKHNIAVNVRVPQDLPTIQGDPQTLKQVFINLFFNAIDAMPDGGTLTIEAGTENGNLLTVKVRDTGEGIHPEALPHIFRPFFTTKEKKGTGLGLSVCERIVRAHGGTISVKSNLGSGTIFLLRFPLTEAESDGRS